LHAPITIHVGPGYARIFFMHHYYEGELGFQNAVLCFWTARLIASWNCCGQGPPANISVPFFWYKARQNRATLSLFF
jgi:hypothetical protein